MNNTLVQTSDLFVNVPKKLIKAVGRAEKSGSPDAFNEMLYNSASVSRYKLIKCE